MPWSLRRVTWGQAGTVNTTVAGLDLIATQGPLANGAILEHVASPAMAGRSGFMCKLTFNERGRIDECHKRRAPDVALEKAFGASE